MAKRKAGGGAFQTSADGDAVWKGSPPPGFPPLADDDDPPAPAEEGRSRRTSTRDYAGPSGGTQIRPTLQLPTRPAFADGAGFALGMILYALGLAYLDEGAYGVRRWFSAKFLNKVLPRQAAASPTAGSGGAGSHYLVQ